MEYSLGLMDQFALKKIPNLNLKVRLLPLICVDYYKHVEFLILIHGLLLL